MLITNSDLYENANLAFEQILNIKEEYNIDPNQYDPIAGEVLNIYYKEGRSILFYNRLIAWYICYPYRVGILLINDLIESNIWKKDIDKSQLMENAKLAMMKSYQGDNLLDYIKHILNEFMELKYVDFENTSRIKLAKFISNKLNKWIAFHNLAIELVKHFEGEQPNVA
jgi:hypothetical protein